MATPESLIRRVERLDRRQSFLGHAVGGDPAAATVTIGADTVPGQDDMAAVAHGEITPSEEAKLTIAPSMWPGSRANCFTICAGRR